MKIPQGVNHSEFFKIAKSKGIKIQSRYTGVYQNYWFNDKNKPCWMARLQKGGKVLFSKRFDFTEQGEKMAGNAYERFLTEQREKV